MEQEISSAQLFLQRKEFYEDSEKYWDKIPATVDGVLGGFGYISHIDILGSKKFLKKLFNVSSMSVLGYIIFLESCFVINQF